MTATGSLGADYFEGIFAGDADPWDLASSDYEAAKFRHTVEALADRRYRSALEVGCAQGVLTGHLIDHCDRLLAIDISAHALDRARDRLGERPALSFAQMAFPREVPGDGAFDLAVLSEVAYYWDAADLDRAANWLADHIVSGGRIILVHYIGETDYPQSGDDAVRILAERLAGQVTMLRSERQARYRLDLWERV